MSEPHALSAEDGAPLSSFWRSVARVDGREVIVDGAHPDLNPENAFANSAQLDLYDRVLVSDVQLTKAHAVVLALAAATNASLLIESEDEANQATATLSLPGKAAVPDPLSDPARPDRMSADLPVDPPTSAGNDYSALIAGARANEMPTAPVSVVIPVYNRRLMLARTLACLTHQTYPLELIEIVIADDGSSDRPDELVDTFAPYFGSVRFVSQADDGYRLAEVRNLGLNAAANEIMILLDCDMAPVPRLVELFARHIEVEPNAVYCGHRRYVDANSISVDTALQSIESLLSLADIRPDNQQVTVDEEEGPTVDWRLPIYQETAQLRYEKHPFRAVCGGNIGFTKTVFARTGPFDESFRAWGGEDAEWGYRAWNRGVYIIPLLDACGLHQEPPGGRNETDREVGREETLLLLAERCPVRFRSSNEQTRHSIPLVSIYIPAYNAEHTIVQAIRSALNQSIRDLEVCVVDDGSTDGTVEVIGQHFGENPRVRLQSQPNGGIGAASNAAVQMCRAPFIGQLDADDLLKKNAVRRMLGVLRSDPRIGVAYSSSELINSKGVRVADSYEFPYYSRYDLMYGMIVHHFRLFRARDWYRTSGFATDIVNAVDYDMYLKLAEVTEMVHLPVQLYRYRKHSTSTSQSKRGTQRANHRLVIGRAMNRRGLSDRWALAQLNPEDVRKYEFVPRETEPSHYGPSIDRVRLLIDVGRDHQIAMATLGDIFPSWVLRKRHGGGRPKIVTPDLSHARAVRCHERIQREFPEAKIKVVYL
jgi:chondroitin synthase